MKGEPGRNRVKSLRRPAACTFCGEETEAGPLAVHPKTKPAKCTPPCPVSSSTNYSEGSEHETQRRKSCSLINVSVGPHPIYFKCTKILEVRYSPPPLFLHFIQGKADGRIRTYNKKSDATFLGSHRSYVLQGRRALVRTFSLRESRRCQPLRHASNARCNRAAGYCRGHVCRGRC